MLPNSPLQGAPALYHRCHVERHLPARSPKSPRLVRRAGRLDVRRRASCLGARRQQLVEPLEVTGVLFAEIFCLLCWQGFVLRTVLLCFLLRTRHVLKLAIVVRRV